MNAGRVLSAANETKLRQARDKIDDVLSSLGNDEENKTFMTLNRRPVSLEPGVLRLSAVRNDAEGKSEADVFIYGDIGGWWDGIDVKDFVKELDALKVNTINARINSGGGIVFDGLAIYHALAKHSAEVIAHIEGIAASIASVIPMAADEIRIYEGTRMMIHKPWSFVIGDERDMLKEAEVLRGLQDDLIDLYQARTDQARGKLEDWVNDETWFSAKDAVANGFADTFVEAKKKEKAARSAMFDLYRHVPKDLRGRNDDIPIVREFESLLRDVEGFGQSQARRIAALASKTLAGQRDVDPLALRDVGEPLNEITDSIRRNIETLKQLAV